MRILITQNHFKVFSGSEILSLELLDSMTNLGHDVSIYTNFISTDMQEYIQNNNYPVYTENTIEKSFDFDLIWVHHGTMPSHLLSSSVKRKYIFNHMSSYELFEMPYLLNIENRVASLVLSNSLETFDMLKKRGISSEIKILGNPAPDHFKKVIKKNNDLKNILFVSNHPPTEIIEAIKILERKYNVRKMGLNWQKETKRFDIKDLEWADLIVSIGKTFQYGLVSNIPCYIYDHFGGPGFVLSDETFQLAQSFNFSGRGFNSKSGQIIANEIEENFAKAKIYVNSLSQSLKDFHLYSNRLTEIFSFLESKKAKSLSTIELNQWHMTKALIAREYNSKTIYEKEYLNLQKTLEEVNEKNLHLTRENIALTDKVGQSIKNIFLERIYSSIKYIITKNFEKYYQSSTLSYNVIGLIYFVHKEFLVHRFKKLRRKKKQLVKTLINKNIPRLAWVVSNTGKNALRVECGAGVELNKLGFFEGVWTGSFKKFRPDKSVNIFGSGFIFKSRLFIPPNNPIDPLFVLRNSSNGNFLVSNSIIFILEKSQYHRNSKFNEVFFKEFKDKVYLEGTKGVDKINPLIIKESNFELYACFFFPFYIDNSGIPHRKWRRAKNYFSDYQQYKNYLIDVVKNVVENGSSPARQNGKLSPINAVSSGYDSAAAAAISIQSGSKCSFTLEGSIYGHNDSGSAVAKILGMNCESRKHFLGSHIENLNIELEEYSDLLPYFVPFFATPGIGDDSNLISFSDILENKIYISGAGGDLTWERNSKLKNGLQKYTGHGRSLTEFRLEKGFAHIPLPWVQARLGSKIKRISNSADMAEFSVRESYDRPIPRRILRESGVDDSLFGREKSATAPNVINNLDFFEYAAREISKKYRS